jgi:hypothetical protein
MDFTIVRPDAVLAINQRWLLKFWKRHQGVAGIPPWQAIESENLTRVSDNVSFLDVTGEGEIKRFQVRQHGANIAKVYGAPDCRGRFLDEVIPRERHPTGLMPYYRAYSTGQPVYTICDVKDKDGRLILFERLILPFGGDGRDVERILSSFEFICEDGAYDATALIKLQHGAPTLRLCALIEPQAAA